MLVTDHSLVNEFPNHIEQIQELNLADDRFHQLYNEYHELDRQIRRIEEGFESAADEYLEGLKKQRVQLKDIIYQRIILA